MWGTTRTSILKHGLQSLIKHTLSTPSNNVDFAMDDATKNKFIDGIKNVVMYNTDMNIMASTFRLYFVTNLINANEPVPPVIFTKPFFHAINQLLLGMQLTNTSTLSPSFREALLASFTTFRASFDPPAEESTEPRQTFCSKLSSPVGRPAVSLTGSVLSSTAEENVTAWRNHVAENFQGFATTYCTFMPTCSVGCTY
ncbi:hypothetical protein DM01DRAFT_1010965 [Hesseltinella vesiculosa]|uniref:Uncharacterized protein n=1 Tax=Hesseltinella vesiculosa TaxID=101127 RepID=A0A1X2GY89_9FUNG|nr:hypothetical protein DM01DRAFT_1010965 [Hesseltinella vesiculosa]